MFLVVCTECNTDRHNTYTYANVPYSMRHSNTIDYGHITEDLRDLESLSGLQTSGHELIHKTKLSTTAMLVIA